MYGMSVGCVKYAISHFNAMLLFCIHYCRSFAFGCRALYICLCFAVLSLSMYIQPNSILCWPCSNLEYFWPTDKKMAIESSTNISMAGIDTKLLAAIELFGLYNHWTEYYNIVLATEHDMHPRTIVGGISTRKNAKQIVSNVNMKRLWWFSTFTDPMQARDILFRNWILFPVGWRKLWNVRFYGKREEIL